MEAFDRGISKVFHASVLHLHLRLLSTGRWNSHHLTDIPPLPFPHLQKKKHRRAEVPWNRQRLRSSGKWPFISQGLRLGYECCHFPFFLPFLGYKAKWEDIKDLKKKTHTPPPNFCLKRWNKSIYLDSRDYKTVLGRKILLIFDGDNRPPDLGEQVILTASAPLATHGLF